MTRWYERESFPIECVCKFKKDDTSSVIDTIVKFTPNNGWYEFIGIGGNSYCMATPLKYLYENEIQLEVKDKEIARLKKYMEVNDELSLFKLALNETVKELVVKPLVKDIVSNLKKEEK